MAKHFELVITDTSLSYRRKLDAIQAEAALDGLYVIRTSVPQAQLDADAAGGCLQEPGPCGAGLPLDEDHRTCTCAPSSTFRAARARPRLPSCACSPTTSEWHMRERSKPHAVRRRTPRGGQRGQSITGWPRHSDPNTPRPRTRASPPMMAHPLHSFRTPAARPLDGWPTNITFTHLNPEAKILTTTRPTPLQPRPHAARLEPRPYPVDAPPANGNVQARTGTYVSVITKSRF